MALNRRQLAFCREYAKDHKGSEAAKRAGYAASGAKYRARDLLKLPEIQAKIEQHEKASDRKWEDQRERAMAMMWRLAEAAEAAGQLGPAVGAVKTIMTSLGMMTEKSRETQETGPIHVHLDLGPTDDGD